MADLATFYMGLKLRNPIIVSSSDLTKSTEGIIRCYEAGAGAVVLKSLYEEQFLTKEDIEAEEGVIYPEALDYLRRGGLLEYGPHEICQMIEEVKKEIDIPIIASINCQSPRLWPSYARQFQEAGADGLELNIYFLPIGLDSPGAEYEEYHLKILEEVKKAVSIPVAVKLMSQLTSIPYLAYKMARAGCDALVLFNWFVEPDIDVKTLKTRNVIGKGNFYQSLRWVALLAGRVDCDVASSGGVRKAEDVIKQILVGASAVQVCTILYEQKFKVIKSLLSEVDAWMDKHKNATIDDFKGELSLKMQELTFKDRGGADAYFRAQYLKTFARAK
jgi:dihydroorotate dehydrogenase (fumarate)